MKINKSLQKACFSLGCALTLTFISTVVLADSGDIGARATAIATSIQPIITVLQWASYIMGVAFALAGMLKFKAHKDQPQQVPLSQPIVLLLIAAGLVGLPAVVDVMKGTLLGEGATSQFNFQ